MKISSKENLKRLMDLYQNLVFSICLKLTGDYFTAEDLTQDTFLSVYQHWESFDGGNEKSWVARIATNKCIDYKRAAARKVIPIDDEMMESIPCAGDPMREVMNKDLIDRFEIAIKELHDPYRTAAVKYFLEGKTAKEVSEETGTGLNAVKTQLFRARSMLKEKIRKEDLNP